MLVDVASSLVHVECKDSGTDQWINFRLSLPSGISENIGLSDRYCGPLSSVDFQLYLVFPIKEEVDHQKEMSGTKKGVKAGWRKLLLNANEIDEKWTTISAFYARDAQLIMPQIHSLRNDSESLFSAALVVSKQGEIFEFRYGTLHSTKQLSSIPQRV